MKRKLLFTKETEYEFAQDGNKYTLYYGNSDEWNRHIRGKKAMRAISTGDSLKIKGKNIDLEFDYSEAHQLALLLSLLPKKFFGEALAVYDECEENHE